jgi:hypothetical protein
MRDLYRTEECQLSRIVAETLWHLRLIFAQMEQFSDSG